jgi:hypothetical protein
MCEIEIWDEDKISDDVIGVAKVPLGQVGADSCGGLWRFAGQVLTSRQHGPALAPLVCYTVLAAMRCHLVFGVHMPDPKSWSSLPLARRCGCRSSCFRPLSGARRAASSMVSGMQGSRRAGNRYGHLS